MTDKFAVPDESASGESREWDDTAAVGGDEDEEVSHPDAPSPPGTDDDDASSKRMLQVSKCVLDDLSKKNEVLTASCAEQEQAIEELQSAQIESERTIEELRASRIDPEQLADIVSGEVESAISPLVAQIEAQQIERDGLTNRIETLLDGQTSAEKQIKRLSIAVEAKKQHITSQLADIEKLNAENKSLHCAIEAHTKRIRMDDSMLQLHEDAISTMSIETIKLKKNLEWSNDYHETAAAGWAAENRRTALANESESLLCRLLDHGCILRPVKGSAKARKSGLTWANVLSWGQAYNKYHPENEIELYGRRPCDNRVMRFVAEMLPLQWMKLDYRHSNIHGIGGQKNDL
jgi:hypothetical protein